MIRAFLAVELDGALRQKLALLQEDLKTTVHRQASKDLRVSWTQPAAMHLTLKFFGNIEESLVDPLHEAVGEVVGAHQALAIPLERLGAFPHLQQPRVIWVGPSSAWAGSADAKRFAGVHRAIEMCGESFGFPSDGKPFNPHVTVARIKGGERTMGRIFAAENLVQRPCNFGAISVESLVLMKSELRAGGSLYTTLGSCRLAGTALS